MERMLDALLETSVYACVITGAILLFRAVMRRRISPRLQYLLWMLLLAKLLLPVSVESGFHVVSLLPERAAATVSAQEGADRDAAVANAPIGRTQPAAALTESAAPQPAAVPETTADASVTIRRVHICVYAGGVAVAGLWLAVVKLRYTRQMRACRLTPSADTEARYRACCVALGVKHAPALWVQNARMSPGIALLGGRSVVLLPAALEGQADALSFALLHELAHYRRGDHLMCALTGALRAVYWFHPAVHLAFARMQEDMETACDARVIETVGEAGKRAYLTTVIDLFSYGSQPQLGMARFTARRMAARRISGAFMRKRATAAACVAAALLVAMLLIGCFTTACRPAPAEKEPVAEAAPIPMPVPESADGDGGARAGGDGQTGEAPDTEQDSPANMEQEEPNATSVPEPRGEALAVTGADGRQVTLTLYSAATAQAGGVTPQQAAAAATQLLLTVYGDRVTDTDAYLSYQKATDLWPEAYTLSYGDAQHGQTATFAALVDANTGDVLSVEDLRLPTYVGDAPVLPEDDPQWSMAGPDCYAAGVRLVRDRLAGGRDVLEGAEASHFEGVQATFSADDPLSAEVRVRMSEGACYTLCYQYPSMQLSYLHCYPLGWEACMRGTWLATAHSAP